MSGGTSPTRILPVDDHPLVRQGIAGLVYPAIYEIWKWHFETKRVRAEPLPAALPSPEPAP